MGPTNQVRGQKGIVLATVCISDMYMSSLGGRYEFFIYFLGCLAQVVRAWCGLREKRGVKFLLLIQPS